MNYQEEYAFRQEAVEEALSAWLPREDAVEGKLCESMIYSMTAGGKHVRPLLMYEACRLFGGNTKDIAPFMTAIECIHVSSLVHDDLPAIDNDYLRRGKPSTHAAYGEPLGILSGDALMNYAYELLLTGISQAQDMKNAVRAAVIIAEKAGYAGMLGGQSLDVMNEKQNRTDLTAAELDNIYERKTAALLEASLSGGAAFAGADEESLLLLTEAGSFSGKAFQIKDDILDVTESSETLGKPASSDEKNGKTTYVTLLGLSAAQEEVEKLTEAAVERLDRLGRDSDFLKEFLLRLVLRKK